MQESEVVHKDMKGTTLYVQGGVHPPELIPQVIHDSFPFGPPSLVVSDDPSDHPQVGSLMESTPELDEADPPPPDEAADVLAGAAAVVVVGLEERAEQQGDREDAREMRRNASKQEGMAECVSEVSFVGLSRRARRMDEV